MTRPAPIAPALAGVRPDSEAELSALVAAVILLDPQARIARLNPAAENLCGNSAKRLIGCALDAAIELSDERVREKLEDCEGPLVARQVSLRAGGTERRIDIAASPLADYPGWRVISLSEAGPDVSAHTGEQAAMGGAPSILAHEIKNPLAAIRGAGQLLARKIDAADQPLAQLITDEVDRIAGLIDRMQQLGRSRGDESEPVNLHAVLRNALATLRSAHVERLEVCEEFDPSLPDVLAQAGALEQVLGNLLSNAFEAIADQDERQITVRTRYVSGPAYSALGEQRLVKLPVELTVTDNGPGVEEALRDTLFEPFVTSKKSGQGLGLALVRKLLEDMGGRISHERDLERGLTHFRIQLPIADGPNVKGPATDKPIAKEGEQ